MKELAWSNFRENENNKAILSGIRETQKERDARISKEYFAHMDEQERKQREAVAKRNERVKGFMDLMEGTVIADENKKIRLLEANLSKYEQKK
jgi:hypothetical protein